jgi:hypothetical protein
MNKNIFHICNHCVDYKTIYKSDMKKHLTKKNKCKSYSEKYTFEEAFDISMCRTYTFLFNTDNLSIKDYAFIIYNYTNINNYINEDFTNNDLIIKNNELICDNLIKYTNKSENENNTDNKPKFICPNCNKEYTSKQNLLKHYDNKSLCIQNQKYNAILQQAIEKQKINETNITNNQNNITNQNVTNNNMINNGSIINNIQNNNNNNSNTSNFNIQVNDFMNDKYDITHIGDDYYEKKDFFIFDKFLEQIMLNKNNHNIYFVDNNNNAIIYTENELNKMSSEKVGYVVLEKIEQAFSELYYKQDEDARKYYEFINSYYRILKGQYRSDTIYKIYDVDERQFKYTSNSRLNRSRDKNLGKIITTINKHHSETKNNLSKCNDNNLEILTIEPNIENFISRRCRYKDLKS